MEIDQRIDAALPRPGLYGPRRNKSPLDPDVQTRLQNYLVRMRNLQDVWYDGNTDVTGHDRMAFEGALQIAQRWLQHRTDGRAVVDGVEVRANIRNAP